MTDNVYTIETLSLLCKLNGYQRLAHLEEEIFANSEYSRNYAIALTQYFYQQRWTPQFLLYIYATDKLQSRWLEAEVYIKTHEKTWKSYCSEHNIPYPYTVDSQ